MELNDVIKELKELKARVSELENRITKEEVPDISGLDWVKYVAANKYGDILGFDDIPIKGLMFWFPQKDGRLESITEKQALALCGRVPQWLDKPIQVVDKSVDKQSLVWANWIATDEIGEIWAYADRPIRDIKSWKTWVSFDAYMEHITPEQAIALCGRLPQWSDDEPTPVKR